MSGGAHVTARFRALDGWRGVCACLVALYHLPIADHLHKLPWLRSGGLYVDFFFVLSGFVIAHGYERKVADGPALGDFMRRRFARLWPLHMIGFLGLYALRLTIDNVWPSFALIKVHPLPVGWAAAAAIALNALLLQGVLWQPGSTVNAPNWSISDEFCIYALFGTICVATAALSRPAWRIAVALVLVAGGIAVLAIFSRFGMEDTGRLSVLRCLAGFFTGTLAWRLWVSGRSRAWGGTGPEVAILIVAVVFIAAAVHPTPIQYLSPAVFAAVILIFANERGALSRILMSAPMAKLGLWSYSIYLTHMIVVTLAVAAVQYAGGIARIHVIARDIFTIYRIVVPQFAGDLLSVLYLLVVIALAALIYAAIEVPGQRVVGLWGWPRRPAPAA